MIGFTYDGTAQFAVLYIVASPYLGNANEQNKERTSRPLLGRLDHVCNCPLAGCIRSFQRAKITV